MSRACDICGKGPLAGHRIVRRGKPKKQGGTGSWIVKRTKRKQLPNLQAVRAVIDGRSRKLRLCAECLKTRRLRLKRREVAQSVARGRREHTAPTFRVCVSLLSVPRAIWHGNCYSRG